MSVLLRVSRGGKKVIITDNGYPRGKQKCSGIVEMSLGPDLVVSESQLMMEEKAELDFQILRDFSRLAVRRNI